MPVTAIALIDTGAAVTGIAGHIISSLQLRDVGAVTAVGADGVPFVTASYPVRLLSSGGYIASPVTAVEVAANDDYCVIIGRDILARGTFTYCGRDGYFTLAF